MPKSELILRNKRKKLAKSKNDSVMKLIILQKLFVCSVKYGRRIRPLGLVPVQKWILLYKTA